jgi:hypothetical protein
MMRDTFQRFQPQDRGRFGDNEQRDNEVERQPSKGGKKLHDLDCDVISHSERAVKVRLHSNGRTDWFPLSQCEVTPKEDGRGHSIAVPEWLLTSKGIL